MAQKRLGIGSINYLDSILTESSFERIFVVTGKKSYETSGAKNELDPFFKNKEVFRFSDFNVNPSLEDLKKGVNQFKAFNPDVLIAIGGGSALDMGKLINVVSANEDAPIKEIITTPGLIEKKGLNLVAIPTTAGTGSEVTQFAAVYISDKKYSVDHGFLLPDYCIVDPNLTLNLPSIILASTAFDALSQAVESYWSVGSTQESKDYSKESIQIILKSMKKAVNQRHPASIESLCYAANLAGKAINITRTTAPHALSYPITINHGIPHGHAVALTLGKFFLINSNYQGNKIIDKRGVKYLSETMEELFQLFGRSNAAECEVMWYRLMHDIGLETNLTKLGIGSSYSINRIVKSVNIQRLRNNPIEINKHAIYCLLNEIS